MFGFKTLKMKNKELEQANEQFLQRITQLSNENKGLVTRLNMAEGQNRAMLSAIKALEEEVRGLRLKLQGNQYSDDSRLY
jgi:hypothetical protein